MGILDYYSGDKSITAGTGVKTLSGIVDQSGNTFTPKIVMLTASPINADGTAADAYFCFGFMDENGVQACNFFADADGRSGTTNTYRGRDISNVLRFVNGGGTDQFVAAYSSFGDGFVQINVTTNAFGAIRLGITAIGGDCITDWDIEKYTLETSSSTTTRDLGYQPDLLFIASHMGTNNDTTEGLQTIGFFGGSNQRCIGTWSQDAISLGTSVCKRVMRNNRVMTRLVGTSQTHSYLAAFTGTGYTLEQKESGATDYAFAVIALAIQTDSRMVTAISDMTEQGSTGEYESTAYSLQPVGLFVFQGGADTSFNSVNSNCLLNIGTASSKTDTYSHGYVCDHGESTTDTFNHSDNNDLLVRYNASKVVQCRTRLERFESNKFVLNEITAGTSGVLIPYLAFFVNPTFPDDWDKKVNLATIGYYVKSEITDCPLMITEQQLIDAGVDATFWANVQDGGGDLRASSDSAGTTQLPIKVDVCDVANEKLVVWVKMPTISTSGGDTCFLWYDVDQPGILQPAKDATYGAENVFTFASPQVRYSMKDKFDDTSVIPDDTANDNDANKKAAGQPTEVGVSSTKYGYGQDFDRSNSEYAAGPILTDTSFAVMINFKMNTATSGTRYRIAGSFNASGSDYGWGLTREVNDKFQLWIKDNLGNSFIIYSDDTYTDNDWHNIILRRNLNEISMYIDGIKQADTEGSNTMTASGQGIRLGMIYTAVSTSNFFDGIIDDFIFWNEYNDITDNVSLMYSNMMVDTRRIWGPYGSGTLHYYKNLLAGN